MSRRPPVEPQPAADLVRAVLKRRGVIDDVRGHRLVTEWHKLVGERIAERAWPDRLEHGILSVRVANSAWLNELSFLKAALLKQIGDALGDSSLVTELRLSLGDSRFPEDDDDVQAARAERHKLVRPKPVARPAASPEVCRSIDEETESVRDPELRDALRGLRKRLGL